MEQQSFTFPQSTKDFLHGLLKRSVESTIKNFTPVSGEETEEFRNFIVSEALIEYAYQIIEHFEKKEKDRRKIIGTYKEDKCI